MALVERDEALLTFERQLAATRQGGGHLVLVSGEAGIGKTTLWLAAIEQARERVVIGEEPQLAQVATGDQCGRGVVGEDPQRLQPVGGRYEPVRGVVDPEDPEQRTPTILERHDQPVPVPCPGPAAVELRWVDVDLFREPGLPLLVS